MEIKVENLCYVYKEKKILKNLSFSISSSSIVGLYGKGKTLLLEILDLTKKYQGKIFLDGCEVGSSNISDFQKQVAFIPVNNLFFMDTVEDEMLFFLEKNGYTPKDLEKRMIDSFRFVGLPEGTLKRKISELSTSEAVLFKIACAILTNPKVFLFDDVFCYLSHSDKRKILSLIRKLKERKRKLVVIASNDVDFLYEFTDEVLLLEKGELLIQEVTSKLFKDVPFLEEHGVDVPNLVKFTYLARLKKVRLSYHRDILDLIKDVYKHV